MTFDFDQWLLGLEAWATLNDVSHEEKLESKERSDWRQMWMSGFDYQNAWEQMFPEDLGPTELHKFSCHKEMEMYPSFSDELLELINTFFENGLTVFEIQDVHERAKDSGSDLDYEIESLRLRYGDFQFVKRST